MPTRGMGVFSMNHAIGLTVAQYLSVTGETRAELGELLGIAGANVSSRLHGKARWTAEDLFRIADHFGVCVDDVRPAANGDGTWVPAPFRLGVGRSGAAGVGVSSHLREPNSRPIHYEKSPHNDGVARFLAAVLMIWIAQETHHTPCQSVTK